ncbi:hypothetical protein E1211_04240 [Micromonospora sp. 15K316]|uniref:hypothetical protein n=1 Tax=Micromonospora sp. 15K316 TaxID=2530376 RepID=UPI001048F412|nr:hypothetical protein [Micromonospora sp. 15K316]TDC39383.1 hypothetical protein E1211_04240 [Micromonospora sp. 15K316]
MSLPSAVATGVVFVWLGMVLAISFLEAPLKFRAPGVTVPVGLGIGRLVFRALNVIESFFALALLAAVALGAASGPVAAVAGLAVAVLLLQLGAVRPRLNSRTRRVLAGEDAPRSGSHQSYVLLEVAKAGTLLTLGILLLATP